MDYRPRVIDRLISERLETAGALLVEGPKACGKTQSGRHACGSEVLLDLDRAAQAALAVDPALVLAGATPRLIDEWQVGGSTLWNSVRRAVDDRRTPGQFILTGSATPADDVTRHSGAGRISRLRMRPMSLFEAGAGTGAISLAGLLNGDIGTCVDPGLTVHDILDLVTVGGWPSNLGLTVEQARRANVDYLATAREVDVPSVAGAARDPRRLGRLFEALARTTATEVKLSALARETLGDDEDAALARSTIYDYLESLERLMLIEDVPAWSTHLRSKARLRKEPKRHFVDPSLAVAALRATPQRLLADLNYAGFLFESMVVRDLRVLSAPLEGEIFHYRDSNGLEVDIVIGLPDGRWGAFEVKLGFERVEDGAASLLKFASVVDQSRTGPPAVLGVITNATAGYRRPDGVAVIPIGALAP